MGKFAAAIEAFKDKTEDQMLRVLQQSLQDTLNDAQRTVAQGGNMPVDTSTLRNSLISELDGAEVARGPDSYTLAIARLKIGHEARFGWGGPAQGYAVARHYKPPSFGQGGGHWRDIAARKWPETVRRNARLVR